MWRQIPSLLPWCKKSSPAVTAGGQSMDIEPPADGGAPLPLQTETPQAVMTRRGYALDKASASPALLADLRAKLTVAPELSPGNPLYATALAAVRAGGLAPGTFAVYRESDRRLYIPRALGLRLFGAPVAESEGHEAAAASHPFPPFARGVSLRPEQEGPVSSFLAAARDPTRLGGILSLPCGGGKTVCALRVAAELGRKTLVVAHKQFLLDQWRERIAVFLPSARVGLIKAKTVDDPGGYDVVLGSLQSIAMKEYAPTLFAPFGLVVFDECHHLSAEVFSRALLKLSGARQGVLMGLSATLDRKDGLRRVFEWFIGTDVVADDRHDDDGAGVADVPMIVHVARYDPATHDRAYAAASASPSPSSYGANRTLWNGQLNYTAMVSDVVNHAPRTAFMVTLLLDTLRAEPGRRALVLSDRRAHLGAIEAEIARQTSTGLASTSTAAAVAVTVGYFMGGMKAAALKASEACHVMLGTVSMAQEAMDCPHLNTLLFATPLSSIEQAVGRIQRQKAADRMHVPLTIDVVDASYGVFRGQARKRHAFYKAHGYVVVQRHE